MNIGIGLGLNNLRGGSSVTAVNPATLALTGYWKPTYSGSPWAGTASAGTSGANSASEATNPPATDVSGGADFDGTNDQITLSGTAATYYSAGAYSGFAFLDVDVINSNAADPFNDDAVFETMTSGFAAVTLKNAAGTITATVLHFGGGANRAASTPFSLGKHFLHWYYTGASLRIGVDGVWSAATATAVNPSSLVNAFRMGTNSGATQFYDGRILELGLANTAISEATFDQIRAYGQSTYGMP